MTDLDHLPQPSREEASAFVWESRDGTKTALGAMGGTHLGNLSRFLERRLARLEEFHDDAMAEQIDDKVKTSFSGLEDRIAYPEQALLHVRAEQKGRARQS